MCLKAGKTEKTEKTATYNTKSIEALYILLLEKINVCRVRMCNKFKPNV